MQEIRAVIDEFPERVLLAEVDVRSSDPGRFYGFDRPRFHLPLNYALLDTTWDADTLGATIDSYLAAVKPHGWPNWVMGSHDKQRIASKLGGDRVGVAAILLFTLPGSAIFYQGDEIGMPDIDIPKKRVRDPFELRVPGYGLGRDPHRIPMRWSPSRHAGFTSGEPWLPVGDIEPAATVGEQREDESSLMNLYRRLIEFRSIALSPDDPFQPWRNQAGVMLFERGEESRRFLVAANLSERRRLLDCGVRGKVIIGNRMGRDGRWIDGRLELQPGEGLVLHLDGP